MFWEWVTQTLKSLPGCTDELYERLWVHRLLRLENQNPSDLVDEVNSRLVCAAVRFGRPLFLVLPDSRQERRALLFATALIRFWTDARERRTPARPVLYFGSGVGIRQQLRKVRVKHERLDTLFHQLDLTRMSSPKATDQSHDSGLPNVITVYGPADPKALIDSYTPGLIAVDCGQAAHLVWLDAVLETAQEQRIPFVAWAENPFSSYLAKHPAGVLKFVWPPRRFDQEATRDEPEQLPNGDDLRSRLVPSSPVSITAVVLEGDDDGFAESLQKARNLFIHATKKASGRLVNDAVRTHWRLLRSLESLPVPLELHEREAQQLWGLKPLTSLRETADCFRHNIRSVDSECANWLERGALQVEQALNIVRETEPPLWRALAQIARQETDTDRARLIVFPSLLRKDLFSLALLARHNIGDEDLASLGNWLVAPQQLFRWNSKRSIDTGTITEDGPSVTESCHPLLVGVPDRFSLPRLLPAFLHGSLELLLYPHQTVGLAKKVEAWSKGLGSDLAQVVTTLSMLSGNGKSTARAPATPKLLRLSGSVGLEVASGSTRVRKLGEEQFWKPDNLEAEVSKILSPGQDFLDDESTDVAFGDSEDAASEARLQHEADWYEVAIAVRFSDGWTALYEPETRLSVVVTKPGEGLRLEKQFVRSLRRGDKALLIHGQRRQSLYELIISRVHQHPNMELTLALIRRWHSDLRKSYLKWCSDTASSSELSKFGERNINGLLRRMQESGSALTSGLTIHFWLSAETLAPQEPTDMKVAAQILGMQFVANHYQRISAAAQRLRGIHRGLANRLNNWLRQGQGLMSARDDTVLDQELGLSFADFQNSLMLLTVQAVSIRKGPFLRQDLGVLEKTRDG